MRKVKLVVVVIAWIAVTIGLVMFWPTSRDIKAEVERRLSGALTREVTIGKLEVEGDHVSLRHVYIANPPGYDGAPLLYAKHIDLHVAIDALLSGEVACTATVTGAHLRVIAGEGTTNLHGMGRPRDGDARLDLAVELAIEDARVQLDDATRGESTTLADVDVRALLTNRDGEKRGLVTVEIAEVPLRGVKMHALKVLVHGDDQAIALDELHGTLGDDGELRGTGRLALVGDRRWSFELDIDRVDLASDVGTVVRTLYPPLAASVDATAARGLAAGHFTVSGAGLQWQQTRPSLAGNGRLTLTDVVLPRGSLLLALAALAGRPEGELRVARVDVELALAEQWITLVRVTSDTRELAVPVTGRVSLDGALDLKVELLPLVRMFGGGAYAAVADVTTSIPVRVKGTVDAPELAPPRAEDLARGLLGGAVRRALQPKK